MIHTAEVHICPGTPLLPCRRAVCDGCWFVGMERCHVCGWQRAEALWPDSGVNWDVCSFWDQVHSVLNELEEERTACQCNCPCCVPVLCQSAPICRGCHGWICTACWVTSEEMCHECYASSRPAAVNPNTGVLVGVDLCPFQQSTSSSEASSGSARRDGYKVTGIDYEPCNCQCPCSCCEPLPRQSASVCRICRGKVCATCWVTVQGSCHECDAKLWGCKPPKRKNRPSGSAPSSEEPETRILI